MLLHSSWIWEDHTWCFKPFVYGLFIIRTKYLLFSSDKFPVHEKIEKLFSFWNHHLCTHRFTQGNSFVITQVVFMSVEASCTNKTEISGAICGINTYVIEYEWGKLQVCNFNKSDQLLAHWDISDKIIILSISWTSAKTLSRLKTGGIIAHLLKNKGCLIIALFKWSNWMLYK